MHGLEKGITQLANHEMNAKVRSNAIALLEGISDDITAGIKVWENFSSSGAGNAEPGSFGGWAGFTIERKLFDIELDARDKAKQASGGQSSLDDPLVELAYSKLHEGQTASEHVQNAIDLMKSRIDRINQLIAQIKNTKPKKAASADSPAKSAATKTKSKKKPAKKKSSARKAKKKSAGKKPAKKKKAAKKKAGKKKVAKKKAAKKKAAKKKAGKKKATKKKAGKKKAGKKKAGKKSAKKKAKKKARRR